MNILHEFFKKITRELLRDRETMKSLSPSRRSRALEVAPYAGAWMEISVQSRYQQNYIGRSLRGSVD